jgi:hypothetical protein
VRRVLLKARFVPLVCFGMLLWAGPLAAQAAAPGAAAGFTLLSALGTPGAVTCTGSTTNSTINGNVGSSGGSASVVHAPNCTITGAITTPVSAAVLTDFTNTRSALASVPCDHPLILNQNQTLTPGVYCSAGYATATDVTLTLSGPANGIWLFKIGPSDPTAYLTGTRFSVVMAPGGGNACNVNWWVAAAATLTSGAAPMPFSGNILAGAGATVTGTSGSTSLLTLKGRVWAGAGVTVTDSTIGGCASAISVPKTKCKSGTSNDTDENAGQTEDSSKSDKSDSSATDRSNNGNDEQGNQDKNCKSGDSDKDKSDKPDSNKDDSKKRSDS